jgi:hypothetical protein
LKGTAEELDLKKLLEAYNCTYFVCQILILAATLGK